MQFPFPSTASILHPACVVCLNVPMACSRYALQAMTLADAVATAAPATASALEDMGSHSLAVFGHMVRGAMSLAIWAMCML